MYIASYVFLYFHAGQEMIFNGSGNIGQYACMLAYGYSIYSNYLYVD